MQINAAPRHRSGLVCKRELGASGLGMGYLSSQIVERSWFRKWLGLIFQPFT